MYEYFITTPRPRVERVKMDPESEPTPKGKRKHSKKTKKNWRKFTDIKEIEEYLEERRKDERTGGPVSEKTDKDLFFIEKGVDGEINDKPLQRKGQRKPLRCEANLHPDMTVKPLPGRKRKQVKRTGSKSVKKLKTDSDGQKEAEFVDSSDDEEHDYSIPYAQIRQQELAAVTSIAKRRARRPKVYSQPAVKDLWTGSTEPPDIPDEHYLRVTRKMPVKKPNTAMKKPSALENVEVPLPGASYNPTFEDHQDLVRAAVNVEEQRLQAAETLERKLTLVPMNHQQREQVWLEEMTEGLFGEGVESGGEEGGGDGTIPLLKRPIRAGDRKTRKVKRKERERQDEERKRAAAKTDKMRMEDVYRLKSIRKEILKEEAGVEETKRKGIEAMKESPFQTKRLGKYHYEAPDIEVQLSSEISGSLRCLKPEGNIAMDRFKSLQKRNIIEPREVVRPFRRYKLKVKEKRSARLPEETS